MKHILLIILITLLFNNKIVAQTIDSKLLKKEQAIQNLFEKIKQTKNDNEIITLNKEILNLFEKALKNKKSFDYDFNKLVNMSKLKSEDKKFKIYTWNLPFSNGTYKYYGFCQYKFTKKIILYQLIDNSSKIEMPEKEILKNTNWYGALYYKILTNTYNNKTYYTLLAWDGNDDFTNKKIIDVLYFENKELFFGQPIFNYENKTINRIIFEYTKQVKMMLKYNKELNQIIFDHLSPSQKKFKDQYIYYGPDMTYDGLEFKNGYWNLKSNIVLKNKKEEIKKEPIKTSY